MGSTRLLGKILLPLEGKPLLLRVVDRVLKAESVDEIIVATTTKERDEKIVELIKNYNPKVSAYRGSEEDVLDRYYQAVKEKNPDLVVRVTSDNPFIDPDIINKTVQEFKDDPSLEYASNNIGEHTYPRGLDTEAIKFTTLKKLWETTTESVDREHVTIHVKRFPNNFKWKTIKADKDYSKYRLTVDEESDYKLTQELYKILEKEKPDFRMQDVIKVLENNPDLFTINSHVEQKNKKY